MVIMEIVDYKGFFFAKRLYSSAPYKFRELWDLLNFLSGLVTLRNVTANYQNYVLHLIIDLMWMIIPIMNTNGPTSHTKIWKEEVLILDKDYSGYVEAVA